MALSDFVRAWAFARKVEDLLGLQTEVRQALQIIDQRLKVLEDRMLRLESDQVQLITEARSAATAAATQIAGAVLSDAVTRLTRLEGRTEQIDQQRQPRLPG
jgi:hypothetical protein